MEGKVPNSEHALDREQCAKATQKGKFALTDAIVVFALAGILWIAYQAGTTAASLGFNDADTCWLLALGRYICKHQALPITDPFSYTFALQHQPFLVYQWLAAVIYYGVFKFSRLPGVLVFHALQIAITFIVIPLIMFIRMRAPLAMAVLLLGLTYQSCSFRFFVRPEMFGFTLLLLWLYVLWEWRTGVDIADRSAKKSFSRKDIFLIAALCVIMLFWSNLHITFVFGLISLFLLILATGLECLMRGVQGQRRLVPLLSGFFAALLASLINPRGVQLWAYLPGILFSPTNQYIPEARPIFPEEFLLPTHQAFLFPFMGLLVVSNFHLAKAFLPLLASRSAAVWKQADISLFSPLIIFFANLLPLGARRAIPLGAIFLLCECAYLMRRYRQRSPGDRRGFLTDFDHQVRNLIGGKQAIFCAAIILCTLHGVYTTMKAHPPSLPQTSPSLKVPVEAIELLAKYPQSGRLLNEARYGDILIWYLPEVMPVFVDTRFAMYGQKLVWDYVVIMSCVPGFQKLLDDYKFDWVFFPADAPLSNYLRSSTNWDELYRDNTAAIFRRRMKP